MNHSYAEDTDSRLQFICFLNRCVKKNKYINKIKSNFALWKVEKMSPPLIQGAFEEKLCTWTLFNKSNIQQGVNLYNVSRYDSCARSAQSFINQLEQNYRSDNNAFQSHTLKYNLYSLYAIIDKRAVWIISSQ